jgi:formate dehydrogenase subunit delta
MTVNIEKLVKMAEQITANMAYTDDQEVVAARVADHLNRFWDPRMKIAMKDYGSDHGEELSPPLREAIRHLNISVASE